MKSIFFTSLSLVLLFSCNPPKKEEIVTTETTSTAATLTEQQKADGWKLLFDGQTLNGWKSYQNKEQNCWDVQDGALHCKSPKDADKRADILTTEQYENFELTFDWKVSPGGNSGVIYRASEEFESPYYSGPEYQVIDDNGYQDPLTELQKAGADYDMYVAEGKTLKPVGEWNQGKIVVNGNHCEHWLNGTKVLEYEIGSDDWRKRKDASKWKNEKGYGMTKKGFIDFQEHGHEVWYKNILIKTL